MIFAYGFSILLAIASPPDAADLVPVDRPVIRTVTVAEWNFDRDTEGWLTQHRCDLSAREGTLVVEATGYDPYFHRPVDLPGGQIVLSLRVKTRTADRIALYWTTDQSPERGEDKVTSFPVEADGQWHECSVRFNALGRLTNLRLDPGNDVGETQIDSVRLTREELHPISVERVETGPGAVRFLLKNHGPTPLAVTAAGKPYTIPGGGEITIERPIEASHPLEVAGIEVAAPDLPPVRFGNRRRNAWNLVRGSRRARFSSSAPCDVKSPAAITLARRQVPRHGAAVPWPSEESQYSPTTSPPALVLSDRHTPSSTVSLTNRAEPSVKSTWAPPGW